MTLIAGVAESDLGITTKSILELQSQAIFTALEDAGIHPSLVDGLFTNGVSRFPAMQVAEYTGLRPSVTDSTMMGGSSYEAFVGHACAMIDAGLCRVAVVSYGSNQRSAKSRTLGGPVDANVPSSQFDDPFGPLNPISMYALAAQRHMHEFGTTSEQLAEVAVAARQWALLNPAAFRHADGPLTMDDVLNSRMIATPLHAADCCLVTDGGGALVLVSDDMAMDLRNASPRVLGWGEETSHYGFSQMPSIQKLGGVSSGARAFAAAGIKPTDIDLTMLYDSFTITPMLMLEALGFCATGESGDFVSGGRIGPGGDFAMNTSGGGLSYAHPGMYGIFLIIEAVRQLRGQCGARQLPKVETALAHGCGGILSSYSTVILSK